MFLLQKETKRTKRACIGNCFEQVVALENLRSAFWKARPGQDGPERIAHAEDILFNPVARRRGNAGLVRQIKQDATSRVAAL